MNDPIFEELRNAATTHEPVALGLISGVKGSSPQKLGAKALFYPDGRIKGTLGGGCLEAEIQQRAIQSLRSGTAQTFDLVLDHDFGWDDGLVCGGKVSGIILPNPHSPGPAFWSSLAERRTQVEWGVKPDFSIQPVEGPAGADWLYREVSRPPCALWIAGAGHIAQAVARLALPLDFAVTVLDDRPALASQDYFPAGVALKADLWDNLLALPLPNAPAFGLIVTRGHRHDALVLRSWLRKPFLFLGMIGSQRKWRTISEHFQREGIATAEELQRVACPVGARIRARTVAEIAVSIVAQYIEKRAEFTAAG